MKHYLEQLIDDIHKATLQVIPPHPLWLESGADPDDEVELEDMSYVEKYLYGEEKPISTITGIHAVVLPPSERLTEEQQAMLAVELEKLLQLFHFHLDFPEAYPANMRYRFIRDIWTKSFVPISVGENHIGFCNYEEENCPFPGYCTTCQDIAADMKQDEPDQNEEADLDDIFGSSEDYDPASDFVGGFFNDDGTPFDPDSVPIPGLCIICKMYQNEDPEENFLCLMNRNDQRNEPNFKCGGFEKI